MLNIERRMDNTKEANIEEEKVKNAYGRTLKKQ